MLQNWIESASVPNYIRPEPVTHPMSTVTYSQSGLAELGIVSTLIDAAFQLAKGRPKSALLLLGAAAVSRKVTGFGTIVSALLRLYQRFRR